MSENLNSNIQINISIKKVADDVDHFLKSVKGLEDALTRLSGKEFEVKIKIQEGIKRELKDLTNEMQTVLGQQVTLFGSEKAQQNIKQYETVINKMRDLSKSLSQQERELSESSNIDGQRRREVRSATETEVGVKRFPGSEEGEPERVVSRTTEREKRIQDSKLITSTETDKREGGAITSREAIRKIVDLENEAAIAIKKKAIQQEVALANEQETLAVVKERSKELRQQLAGSGFKLDKQQRFSEIGRGGIAAESFTFSKQLEDGRVHLVEINEKTRKISESMEDASGKTRKVNVETRRTKALMEALRLEAAGYTKDLTLSKTIKTIDGNDVMNVSAYVKKLEDGTIDIREINEKSGEITKKTKENTEEQKRLNKAARELLDISKKANEATSRKRAGQFHKDRLRKEGYTDLPSTFRTDALGNTTEIVRAFKATRTGIADMTAHIVEYNTKTGILSQRTKTGADAIRFLGDGLLTASKKVLTWTAATSVLFAALRTIKALGSQIMELESNTVFLSRVSDRLVSGINNEVVAFREKQRIAENITKQTVDLNAEIGGMATEAQKAASVFLRAGQTEEETMYGVAASLLAARIAELDLNESSQLLVSTLLQFNLAASDLIPTLDTLNTLSNNYSVTTQDLFDSISRSGAIFSEQNGTVSELASLTAIAAETTKRSGSQIGNAYKTIISRLNSMEVRAKLFETLGFNTIDYEGKSKSLTDTLFQLSLVMDKLSEAEKKELLIKIAGVRQANILIASINEVDRAMLAHSRAMKDSGSAYEEYKETAKTLESALGRLQGEFTKLANTYRVPIGSNMEAAVLIATELLRIITKLSEFLGSGNIINVSSFIAFNVALRVLLGRLGTVGPAIANLNVLTHDYGATKRRVITTIRSFNSSLSATESVGARVRRGLKGTINQLKSLATVQNLATVAIFAYVHMKMKQAEQENAVISLLERQTALIDAEAANAKKRVEGILSIRDAFTDLFVAVENYENEMRVLDRDSDQFKVLEEQVQSAKETLEEFAKEYDVKINFENPFTLESFRDLNKQFADLELLEINKQRDSLNRKKEERARELKSLRRERLSLREALDKEVTVTRYSGGNKYIEKIKVDLDNVTETFEKIQKAQEEVRKNDRFYRVGIGEGTTISGADDFNRNHERLIKIERDISEKTQELNEIHKQTEALASTPANTETLLKVNRLHRELKTLEDQAYRTQQSFERSASIETALFGSVSPDTTLRRINKATDELAMLTTKIRKLKAIDLGADDDVLEGFIERTKELNEELKKLIPQYEALVFKTIVGYNEEMSKMQDVFDLEIILNKKRLAEAVRYTTEVRKIREMDIKDSIIRRQISESKTRVARNISDGDDAKAEGEKVRLQRLLNQLKDNEYNRMMEILSLEKKIAEARIKGYEEASKKAVELSFADKARLIAQAYYLNTIPGQEIDFMTQFNRMNPDQAKFLREHFPTRAGNIDPEGHPIERALIRAGFGADRETAMLEKELNEYKAGKTPLEIADESLEKLATILQNSTFLETGIDVSKHSEKGTFTLTQRHAVNNLIIPENAFSLTPFRDDFKVMMRAIITNEVNKLSQQLDIVEPNVANSRRE